jgi:3-methyladenine DNA glycosylase AlkD
MSDNPMSYDDIISLIKSQADPKATAGMAKFGINVTRAYGTSIPALRVIAKKIGKRDHTIAQELWKSDIHEARLLASMIDDYNLVTEEQMDEWVKGFDSWDICDQCCSNLFDKTRYAYKKATEWSSGRDEEFVKRAGFALMATLAVHDKKAENSAFLQFLPIIREHSTDERNFVKKAVNWALRQIGKRNLDLNKEAVKTSKSIQNIPSATAKWIASNAISELTSPSVQTRLQSKE